MKAKKVTEGEGYISGDWECWCIHDVPFKEWKERVLNCIRNDGSESPEGVYPFDFFPPDLELDEDGFDYDKKIKYKVTVEVEHIES